MTTKDLPLAIFLMGPTGAGKTSLAVELTRRFPCEIISVDSTQVYRGLDIGSGKPDAALLARAPHHLIDFRDPADPYSAADFRADALAAMRKITAAGKIPLLAGGTMLYFKALRDGLAALPAADEAIREKITELAARSGWAALHRRLAEVDPRAAARIRPTDTQRLQRALEVHEITGRPISSFHGAGRAGLPYRLHQIALFPRDRASRARLHQHIEARFLSMLEAGLVNEVRRLKERSDLGPSRPAIRAVGYRQVWEYLDGAYDYETMVFKATAATRQLAKRQLTWLRSWPRVSFIDPWEDGLVDTCLRSLPWNPSRNGFRGLAQA